MDNRNDFMKEMPFYMTYPMQNLYLTEMEYEKDMERMKELYPREVQAIQQMIEEYCNRMEYEGSRMYDENPDRHMLEEETERLYERFLNENPQYNMMRPVPPKSPMSPMPPMPRQMPMLENGNDLSGQQRGPYNDNRWLRSLIGILFHNEIYRRRCRNRRCRRWW